MIKFVQANTKIFFETKADDLYCSGYCIMESDAVNDNVIAAGYSDFVKKDKNLDPIKIGEVNYLKGEFTENGYEHYTINVSPFSGYTIEYIKELFEEVIHLVREQYIHKLSSPVVDAIVEDSSVGE